MKEKGISPETCWLPKDTEIPARDSYGIIQLQQAWFRPNFYHIEVGLETSKFTSLLIQSLKIC